MKKIRLFAINKLQKLNTSILFLMTIIFLNGCSSARVVDEKIKIGPENKDRGFAMFSVSCMGLNIILVEYKQSNSKGRGFFESESFGLLCNTGAIEYYLLEMPADKYRLMKINFWNKETTFTPYYFELQPGKVTYLGRFDFLTSSKGKNIFDMYSRYNFNIYDKRTEDFPYFYRHYPNLSSKDYVVNIAEQKRSD